MSKPKESGMKYYKLGNNPSIFFDAISGLKVSGNTPAAISAEAALKSKRLTVGIAGKHIIEIEKDEFDKLMAKAEKANAVVMPDRRSAKAKVSEVEDNSEEDEDDEDEYDAMTKDELDTEAEEQGMEGSELAAFKKMNKAEKVAAIKAFVEED